MNVTGTRIIAAALLAAQSACMTGPRRVTKYSPKNYLEANSPSRVWATTVDGDQIIIDGPKVISDTVFGWAEGEEFVLPADQLQEIRVQQLSVFRSVLGPTILLAAVVVLAVTLKKSPTPFHDPDIDSTLDAVRQLSDPPSATLEGLLR